MSYDFRAGRWFRVLFAVFSMCGLLGKIAGFAEVTHADPPRGYPNTSSYSTVQIKARQIILDPLHNSVVVFRTENSLVCSFNPLGDVVCQGHSPLYFTHLGLGTNPHFCPNYTFHTGILGSNKPADYRVFDASAECVSVPNTEVVLKPQQKISYNAAECALGNNQVFSCTNQMHGFVLRPENHNWFF